MNYEINSFEAAALPEKIQPVFDFEPVRYDNQATICSNCSHHVHFQNHVIVYVPEAQLPELPVAIEKKTRTCRVAVVAPVLIFIVCCAIFLVAALVHCVS
ncbi:unnamed protein product, partial [Mesorhabditis spiculigera]